MTWIIRQGMTRGQGLYWSHGDENNGIWRPTADRPIKYDVYRGACVVVGNLSAQYECRLVKVKPVKPTPMVRVPRRDLDLILRDLLNVADMQRISGAGVSVARHLSAALKKSEGGQP